MHPSSLLSYYPTYAILDEVINRPNCSGLNLFIDLKNALQTTYMEHAIKNIISSSKQSRFLDTSIFISLLSFLAFHKIYALKREINIEFFIFYEVGKSYYHSNISKKYKISRRIDDLYGLDKDDRDLFRKTLQANLELIDRAGNRIPSVHVLKVENLEADFIPYYLLTRNLIKDDEKFNLVYSNDHDLYQCVTDNCYVFSKSARTKKLIKKNEVMKNYLHKDTNIPDKVLPIAMSIIGDTGDDVQGINGIGPTRFIKIFDELVSIIGNLDSIYDKVERNEEIFGSSLPKNLNKYTNLVVESEKGNGTISKNLRLVSFELISRFLENPIKTEMLDRKKKILSILQEKEIVPINSLKTSLEKVGVYFGDEALETLYYQK